MITIEENKALSTALSKLDPSNYDDCIRAAWMIKHHHGSLGSHVFIRFAKRATNFNHEWAEDLYRSLKLPQQGQPDLTAAPDEYHAGLVADMERAAEELVTQQGKPTLSFGQVDENYLRLAAVFDLAYDQAANGKGKERHAKGMPFHEQRMQQISHLLQSPKGMAYQVCKKVAEGIELPGRDAKIRELLGAINYLAGMVIYIEDTEPQDGGVQ